MLNKYILLLIIACLPALSLKDIDGINQEHQFIYKDNTSGTTEPDRWSEEKTIFKSDEKIKPCLCDSAGMENFKSKFRKQIILGN